MMEDKIVRQYVRAVSRKLICSKATRSKLLNGFVIQRTMCKSW